MRSLYSLMFLTILLGLAAAQPPRKEEEDPKAKPAKPIDIESFPPPKTPPKAKAPEGPGVAPGAGVLVIGVRSLPERLSPRLARTDPDRWAVDLLFDSLIKPMSTDSGVAFEPSLAASAVAEPGGRAFTLDARAKWSDGTPILANDVLTTIEKMRAHGNGDAIGEATSDAPRRLKIGLRVPSPDPASMFTFKILPAARPDDEAFAAAPLGSGPFTFGSVATQGNRSYAIFPVNPHAAQRSHPPQLREVRFLAGPDPITDFRRGLADVVLEERSPAVFGTGGFGNGVQVVTVPSRRIYYLSVNPVKMALGGDAGRALRRAIAFAIQRETILDEVWRSKEVPFHKALTGPFPSGSWACDPESPRLDDASLAKAELRSTTAPSDKLIVIYDNEDLTAGLACTQIANQLKQLMNCEAKGMNAREFAEALAAKQFDLAYRKFDYRDDWFDPAELFSPANGGNGGGTGAARLDASLARASSRTEFTALRDARRKLHRDFRDVMPFIPLWCLDVHVILRRGVEAYPAADRLDPLAPLADIDRWRVNR